MERLKNIIRLNYIFAKEAFYFYRFQKKYNASCSTHRDIKKFQYAISKMVHTIEKGMTLRYVRKGFGQEKVIRIIRELNIYKELYFEDDPSFLDYPLSVIDAYINYQKNNGVNIDEIESLYGKLSGNRRSKNKAGTITLKKEDILSVCDKNYESLLYSRHSMRYFDDEEVPDSIILKALKFAQRTPSACNRQGWLTHVFRYPQSIELSRWQGGCRGFEEEIKCAILVTANRKAFFSHEVFQAYIDGGLYAMNLINAFHSLGLGCIPLSCGFNIEKLRRLKAFGIPDNEAPIIIIGVGNIPNEVKIAVSERKDINETNIFHK
jgi:nitroreductase